jgi:hypothetical protein
LLVGIETITATPVVIQNAEKIKNSNHMLSFVVLVIVMHHTAIPIATTNKIIATIIINKILKVKSLS